MEFTCITYNPNVFFRSPKNHETAHTSFSIKFLTKLDFIAQVVPIKLIK